MNRNEILLTLAIPLSLVVILATVEYVEGWQTGTQEDINFRILSLVIIFLGMPAARFVAWCVFGKKEDEWYPLKKEGQN